MNKITPIIFLWFISTAIWAVESMPPLVPEGEQIASSPEELEKLIQGTKLIQDTSQYTILESFFGIIFDFENINSIAYSPDGQHIASSSDDNMIKVWEVATGKQLRCLEGHTAQVWSVAYRPDGQQLASGSSDKTVRVWEMATGKQLLRLEGHTAPVWSVAYRPDGQQLASGSSDKTVRVWEMATGKQLLRLEGHTDPVWSVV